MPCAPRTSPGRGLGKDALKRVEWRRRDARAAVVALLIDFLTNSLRIRANSRLARFVNEQARQVQDPGI